MEPIVMCVVRNPTVVPPIKSRQVCKRKRNKEVHGAVNGAWLWSRPWVFVFCPSYKDCY